MHSILKLVIAILVISSIFTGQLQAQSKRRVGKARPSVEAIKPSLPYSVVVEPGTDKHVEVVLAVNTVTTVRCPETPGNLAIGNDADLDQDKFKNSGTGFFLRPRKAGLSTNIVVDFNGRWTAEFYIRVVDIKGGARPGDYTGEVIIQKPVQSDLLSTTDELNKSREEVKALQSNITELETKLREQSQLKLDQSEIELLKLVEAYTQGNYRPSSMIDLPGGRARIQQLDKAKRTDRGWIIVVEIENRSKEQLSLTEVKADQGRVLTSNSSARQLTPRTKTRLAIFIESPSTNAADASLSPKQLVLIISGASAIVRIEA